MLFSQAIEERHFMKREISLRQGIARNIPCLTTKDFPVRDLAKRESPARSCSHEILELAERDLPSIGHSIRTALAATLSVVVWCRCPKLIERQSRLWS